MSFIDELLLVSQNYKKLERHEQEFIYNIAKHVSVQGLDEELTTEQKNWIRKLYLRFAS